MKTGRAFKKNLSFSHFHVKIMREKKFPLIGSHLLPLLSRHKGTRANRNYKSINRYAEENRLLSSEKKIMF